MAKSRRAAWCRRLDRPPGEPGEIPKDEILWSLRGVSGMPWGDEPERWEGWQFNLQPMDSEPIAPGSAESNGPAVVPTVSAESDCSRRDGA